MARSQRFDRIAKCPYESSPRTRGPITPGVSVLKKEAAAVPKANPRRMGPRVRGDDERANLFLRHATYIAGHARDHHDAASHHHHDPPPARHPRARRDALDR